MKKLIFALVLLASAQSFAERMGAAQCGRILTNNYRNTYGVHFESKYEETTYLFAIKQTNQDGYLVGQTCIRTDYNCNIIARFTPTGYQCF